MGVYKRMHHLLKNTLLHSGIVRVGQDARLTGAGRNAILFARALLRAVK
jgi:hypothetical protein